MSSTGKRLPSKEPPPRHIRLSRAVHRWQLAPWPRRFRIAAKDRLTLTDLARLTKSRLSGTDENSSRARMEICLIDWLYATIRLNIKRGRLFEIDRVLSQRQADCLGFSLLFHQIGKRLGLDTGIVEVLIDNAGRPVPHVVNIAKLSDGRIRFVDLWYGSTNVHHRRIGLTVRQAGRWRILDVDRGELGGFEKIRGLPPRCVAAIAGYMIGNRHLELGLCLSHSSELRKAVRCYTDAVARYPQNARLYFNRAVAFENLGDKRAAQADYAMALRDEASLIRVQARQHDEVVGLIALDRMGLSVRDEKIYLLRKGLATSKEVSPERIAARLHMSPDDVKRIVSRIESQLLITPPASRE